MSATDLYVESAGAGEPALALVHAGIADRHQWDREFTRLATRNRVVRYDVRGFGASPDPVHDYYDHDDLLGVMDATGVDRAVLVGSSNGGRIVLDTAVTAPERVTAMVLASSALPGVPLDDDVRADLAAEDEALDAGDIDRALAINLRLFVDGVDRGTTDVNADVRDTVTTWLRDLLPRQAAQFRGGGDAQLVEPLVRDRLGDVDIPALVLIGRHDAPGFDRIGGHLADHLPRARLVEVDGAAHLINLEQPTRFAALLDEFLATL